MDKRHVRISIEAALILFLLFMLFLLTVMTGLYAHTWLYSLDRFFAHASALLRTPFLTSFMLFITYLGNAPVVLSIEIVLGCILAVTHRKTLVPLSFAALLLGQIASYSFKTFAHRPRPELNLLGIEGNDSFPSGHALISVIVYGIIVHLLLKRIQGKALRRFVKVGGFVIPLLVGLSRVYLGVHYFSDVLGGWLFGGMLLVLIILFFEHAETVSLKTVAENHRHKLTAILIIALLLIEGFFIYYFYRTHPLPGFEQVAEIINPPGYMV